MNVIWLSRETQKDWEKAVVNKREGERKQKKNISLILESLLHHRQSSEGNWKDLGEFMYKNKT